MMIGLNSHATFINNVMWGNTADEGSQVYLWDDTADPDFYFCDIEGGVENFGGESYEGIYEYNLDDAPLFVDPENDDYELLENSPCIDRGVGFWTVEGDILVDIPLDDYSSYAPDMGMCEYDNGPGLGLIFDGVVTDAASGEGVANAQVCAVGEIGNSSTSDESGNFTIRLFRLGEYSLNATRFGYYDWQGEAPYVFDGADTVAVEIPMTSGYIINFEENNGEFDGEGEWEWGMPTEDGGPAEAYSGVNCWGTDLDGNYGQFSNYYLYSCTYEIANSQQTKLQFYHWYQIYNHMDGGNVKISTNGGDSWELITPEGGYPDDSVIGLSGEPGFTANSNGWQPAIFDISQFVSAGDMVQFRFRFGSSATQDKGWFIDDMVVLGAEPSSGISDNPVTDIPRSYNLSQNFPNPFNPTTTIQFEMPRSAKLALRIYDVSGKLVKTLVDEPMDAGYHSVIWDGKDESGKEVGSGVYFYRIQAGDYEKTKRMILLR